MGDKELKQFSIAGADHKFMWTRTEIKGNKVIVWNENILLPVVVQKFACIRNFNYPNIILIFKT